MLKISQIEPGSRSVTFCLEGRIVGPWVTELHRACEQVLGEGRSLHLHLAEVEFMDARGVAVISSLRSRGVSLLDCPPFVAEQLKTL